MLMTMTTIIIIINILKFVTGNDTRRCCSFGIFCFLLIHFIPFNSINWIITHRIIRIVGVGGGVDVFKNFFKTEKTKGVKEIFRFPFCFENKNDDHLYGIEQEKNLLFFLSKTASRNCHRFWR